MIIVELFGKKGSVLEHTRVLLEQLVVKENLKVKVLSTTNTKDFIVHQIEALPAIKIGDQYILGSDFDDEVLFVRHAIGQIRKKCRVQDLRRIVVPTDFSKVAENAFKYSLQLAKEIGAIVKLVHVFYPISSSVDGMVFVDPKLEELNRNRFEKYVDDWEITYKEEIEEIVGFEKQVCIGQATTEIESMSASLDVDLIVMGSTGSGNTLKTLFGSVSLHVARYAKCPVLIVPPEYTYKTLDKIVYGSIDAVLDQTIVHFVRNLMGALHSRIDAVHLYDQKTNFINEGIEVLHENPLENTKELILFKPKLVEALSDYARHEDADLIVLERKARSFWTGLFHKSITRKMALHAPVPVLILHEEDHDPKVPSDGSEVKKR